ncbi:type IV secretory system conjugative DNA transfer family protein [uncultured Bradyrhizobium sp.]|uniref:type IV secretory system conjugative DNA transfer family protein n=1 Tax=uncultured Bradyrhizobium sp. TaxID=199684 RepID=UPI0035CC6B88
MSVHGTASFATRHELIGNDLIVPGVDDEDSGKGIFIGWWREHSRDYRRIEYAGDLHQLIVGGTGGGKFTTALAPMLLGSFLEDQTVVVVDPKGEIARLVGTVFQQPFAAEKKVILLDPWDDCATAQTAALNVLDEIGVDNPRCVDDARALADAMVIPSGNENTHWDNAARNFLTALILLVGLDPSEKERRDLTRVRDLITMPWEMPKTYKGPARATLSSLIFKHLENKLAGGAIKRGFSSILNREDKERSGIISSIERDTAWIDSPQMHACLTKSSFDLKDIARGFHKYFIVIPFEYMETHRGWLRLMIVAFAKALRNYPAAESHNDHRRWRHIIIDEFATLGEMSFVRNDVAIARAFNVKYHLVVQDFAQLKGLYGDRWHSFVNNSFQRVFAVGDLFTAEQVSKIAGSATVHSESRSSSETESRNEGVSQSKSKGEGLTAPPQPGSSFNHGESLSLTQGGSTGWSKSVSFNPVQRALITPDEVRRLPENEQLLLFRGMQPIRCLRLPYFDSFFDVSYDAQKGWALPYSLKETLDTAGNSPADVDAAKFGDGIAIFRIHPSWFPLYPEPAPPLAAPVEEGFVITREDIALAAGFSAVVFVALFMALDVAASFWPNPAWMGKPILFQRSAQNADSPPKIGLPKRSSVAEFAASSEFEATAVDAAPVPESADTPPKFSVFRNCSPQRLHTVLPNGRIT